jgi:flagellar protein FlaG
VASVSVSHLILFIASMVVAASVAGVFTDAVGQLSGAVGDRGLDVSEEVRTDVEVISDSGSDAVYNDTGAGNVTIHVKNTGSTRLAAEPGAFELFVDGTFVGADAVSVTVLGGATAWRPGEVARLEIDRELEPGDHRVKVIVNGDEEVFEFRT